MFTSLAFPSLVADIYPGSQPSHPRLLTSINGKIYFTAEVPGEGRELYVYDGVNAPVPVIINPGSNASDPDLYTELNGKIYFAGTDNAKGRELRVYDPVTGVASLVADINASTSSGMVSGIVKWNSKIYFTASDGNFHGCELYSYDGTSVVRLTDLTVGTPSGASYVHAAYNGDIYFSGTEVGGNHYKLYKYNVSNNVASLVVDLDIREVIVYDGRLIMAADDGIVGNELWAYDGVSTTMLADIAPGPVDGLGSVSFCIHNNKLFFTANNGSSGNELYSLSNVAGLKNERFDASVTVFPNPATANATLSLSLKHPETLTISVADAVGRMVWTGEAISYAIGIHNISLPISTFVPAVYCYNIINEQGKLLSSGKILKQ